MRLRFLVAAAVPLLVASLVAGACVPDFAFRDGVESTTSGGGDGDGDGDGGRRGDGGDEGDGGRHNPTGKASASASTGPGPAGPTSTQVAQSSSAGAGGDASTTTTTGDATSSSTGIPPESAPCFQGDQGTAVECYGAQPTCCIDMNSYAEDGCVANGTCDDSNAWPAECNEDSDCPGLRCCMNLDVFLDFYSYTCESSCFDSDACDPLEPDTCDFGSCQPRFEPDENHPEYDHYGFCD